MFREGQKIKDQTGVTYAIVKVDPGLYGTEICIAPVGTDGSVGQEDHCNPRLLKMVIVKTVCNHPVSNPGRVFLHHGYLDGEGVFWYDGNWAAEDNTSYNYPGEEDGEEDQWIDPGQFEVVPY
jgi:hypothetical protein